MKKEISKDQLDNILNILGLDEETMEQYLKDSNKDSEVKPEEDETDPSFIGVCYFKADDSDGYSQIAPVHAEGMHPEWVHDYVEYPDEDSDAYEVALVFNDEEDLKEFLKNPETDPTTLNVTSVKPMDIKDWTLLSLLDEDTTANTLDRSSLVNKAKELGDKLPSRDQLVDMAQKLLDNLK